MGEPITHFWKANDRVRERKAKLARLKAKGLLPTAAELEQAKAMTTVQPRRIEPSNAQCPKCGKPYGSATSCRMNPCGMWRAAEKDAGAVRSEPPAGLERDSKQ